MPVGDNDLGTGMTGKWFTNRGQVIQVACAVILLIIGIITQWNQLWNAFDLASVLKVLAYPATALLCFQAGKYVQSLSSPARQSVKPQPTIKYQFLTPTVQIGSYFDIESEQILGLSRVSVISIANFETGSEASAALVEVVGTILYLSAGARTKKLNSSRFLIQANSKLKSDEYSVFQFTCQKDSLSLTSISVDHINLPAQEVTFAICIMQYRAP
jgi:hypothetical protein